MATIKQYSKQKIEDFIKRPLIAVQQNNIYFENHSELGHHQEVWRQSFNSVLSDLGLSDVELSNHPEHQLIEDGINSSIEKIFKDIYLVNKNSLNNNFDQDKLKKLMRDVLKDNLNPYIKKKTIKKKTFMQYLSDFFNFIASLFSKTSQTETRSTERSVEKTEAGSTGSNRTRNEDSPRRGSNPYMIKELRNPATEIPAHEKPAIDVVSKEVPTITTKAEEKPAVNIEPANPQQPKKQIEPKPITNPSKKTKVLPEEIKSDVIKNPTKKGAKNIAPKTTESTISPKKNKSTKKTSHSPDKTREEKALSKGHKTKLKGILEKSNKSDTNSKLHK